MKAELSKPKEDLEGFSHGIRPSFQNGGQYQFRASSEIKIIVPKVPIYLAIWKMSSFGCFEKAVEGAVSAENREKESLMTNSAFGCHFCHLVGYDSRAQRMS